MPDPKPGRTPAKAAPSASCGVRVPRKRLPAICPTVPSMSTLNERELAVLRAMISYFNDHHSSLPHSYDLAQYVRLTHEEIIEAGDELERRGYVRLDRSAFGGWAVFKVTWEGQRAAQR